MTVKNFFKNIYHDLYYDVYKAMGGSLEDEAVNWSLYLSKIASTGIKILILVAILAAVYRAVLLVIRYNRLIPNDSKYAQSFRLAARLLWLFASLLAVMSQLNFEPDTVKATAKAGIWSVIFYTHGHLRCW